MEKMEKKKAKGMVRIVIGSLLLAFQISIYLGVVKIALGMGVRVIDYISWNIGTYSFWELIGFNCFGWIGVALLIWGICARKKSRR